MSQQAGLGQTKMRSYTVPTELVEEISSYVQDDYLLDFAFASFTCYNSTKRRLRKHWRNVKIPLYDRREAQRVLNLIRSHPRISFVTKELHICGSSFIHYTSNALAERCEAISNEKLTDDMPCQLIVVEVLRLLRRLRTLHIDDTSWQCDVTHQLERLWDQYILPLPSASTLTTLKVTVCLLPGYLSRILQYTKCLETFEWTSDTKCESIDHRVWQVLLAYAGKSLQKLEFKNYASSINISLASFTSLRYVGLPMDLGDKPLRELLPPSVREVHIYQEDDGSEEPLNTLIKGLIGSMLPELQVFLVNITYDDDRATSLERNSKLMETALANVGILRSWPNEFKRWDQNLDTIGVCVDIVGTTSVFVGHFLERSR